MSSLPIEVLDNIFSYLHYEQKVNCMLVCQHWANVIRTLSLFNTLVLKPDDGFQNCNLLVQKLENEPQLSGQVRRLILFGGFSQYNVLSKLIELFPQLHVLYLRQIHVLRPDIANTTTPQSKNQISRWQHSLERLVERQTCVFSTGLLKLGVFPHLTELSLTRGDNDEIIDNIFEILENTPALNQLELGGYDISWQDLELLHKNVPLLVVLLLNSVKTPRDRFNGSVEPVSHLKTLAIQHCELGYDTQFHWIRYIVQKYSSLEHFTFSVRPILDQRHVDKDEYYERLVMPLMDGLGTQLETFVLNPSLITPKLFEALDSKGYCLKKVDMDLLNTPELNESLFRSHQATYLHTLSLVGADFKSFKPFKVFDHLKTLNLNFSEDHSQMIQEHNITSIALNEVLADLPSKLEELTLISCAVRIEPFVSSYPSQLKSLTFEYAALDGQVSTFISDYCRHLKTLSLILCQPGLSTFYLPDHRLSCFEIFSHDTQSIFKLTIGNQTCYYQMNRVLFHGLKGIKKYFSIHDTPAFATRKPNHYNYTNSNRPIIHLTCGSLSALYINTRLAI